VYTVKSFNNEIITTLFVDRAESLVDRYKFIKGFKGGELDFYSSKNAKESFSKIKIYNLRSFTIEGDILPKLIDEIPILTVAACFCNGVSEIKDAQELRVKETDRLKVMARQLQKFGAEITEKKDGLIINGQSKFNSAEVDSETDHRVAMSLAIASLLAKGTSKIMRADAASVSYPTFWDELAKLTN